jgi:hypothetical protein
VQRPLPVPARGRIGLPKVEVAELVEGRAPRVVELQAPRRGLLAGFARAERSRYLVEGTFALLEILDDVPGERGLPRCVLRVWPGMRGEITVGVARLGVEQILADPSLREVDGSARLPLPNGARLRVQAPDLLGSQLTVLARVGGPPLSLPQPSNADVPDTAPAWAL